MNMPKKFLTMAVLTFALHSTVHAYDVSVIETKVAAIVNFAKELRKETTDKAKKAAKRLSRVAHRWATAADSAQEAAEQADLIDAINKIINSRKSSDEKIARLLEILPKGQSRLALAYDNTKKTVNSWRGKIAKAIAPDNQ